MAEVATDKFENKETASLVTEVELIYRNKQKATERTIVWGPDEAHELLIKSWNMNRIELQEEFRIMLLDRKNGCMGISTVATGGLSNCLVDLKIVFALALKARASSIILAHNHPSGNKTPSEQDKKLTMRFQQAGKLLELDVLDHLIITKEGYTSLNQSGIVVFD